MLSDKRLSHQNYMILRLLESEKIMNTGAEQSTQVSGSADSGMVTAGKIGMMAPTTKATGSWVVLKERVPSTIQTAIYMRVNGETTWLMAMAPTFTLMDPLTRASGRMINRMGPENSSLMGKNIVVQGSGPQGRVKFQNFPDPDF